MDQEDSDLVSVSEFSQEEDQSSSHNDSNIDLDKKKKKSDYIGHKESQGVFRAKMMVYLVLIMSCATASALTYLFTSEEETKTFKHDVRSRANLGGGWMLYLSNNAFPSFPLRFSSKHLRRRSSARSRQACFPILM